VLIVVPGLPSTAVVAKAAAALRAGEVIVLPTETVYGLAALPGVRGATKRLFALKGRSADVPLAVLCADVGQALSLAERPSARVREVAERCWPGPLTLVLTRRAGLGYELGDPPTTIGVRCPDHPLVQAIAREVGPLATTSANRHGEPTPADAAGVEAVFGDEVGLVLDGGRCAGVPSTVIDATGNDWTVLRRGELSITFD
jgi:L-threonylcarbamoyladenylate synthase